MDNNDINNNSNTAVVVIFPRSYLVTLLLLHELHCNSLYNLSANTSSSSWICSTPFTLLTYTNCSGGKDGGHAKFAFQHFTFL